MTRTMELTNGTKIDHRKRARGEGAKNCIGRVVDIKTSNNKMQLETLSYLFAIYCSQCMFVVGTKCGWMSNEWERRK